MVMVASLSQWLVEVASLSQWWLYRFPNGFARPTFVHVSTPSGKLVAFGLTGPTTGSSTPIAAAAGAGALFRRQPYFQPLCCWGAPPLYSV
jgi:hypothetical protein